MERIAKSNEEVSSRHAVRHAKDMEVNDAILERTRLEVEVLRLRATQAREDIDRFGKVASELAAVLDGEGKGTDGNG
jgi:hypothetical protein